MVWLWKESRCRSILDEDIGDDDGQGHKRAERVCGMYQSVKSNHEKGRTRSWLERRSAMRENRDHESLEEMLPREIRKTE